MLLQKQYPFMDKIISFDLIMGFYDKETIWQTNAVYCRGNEDETKLLILSSNYIRFTTKY